MRNKFKNQKGFTVLESIVAIFILSLSVSGAFSAVQQSFSQAIIAKDEVRAFYLAQEAVEIIRNKRDVNQLNKIINGSANTWLTGIAQNSADPCYFGKTCRMDAKSYDPANPPFGFVNCGAGWGSCPNINQDPNTFLYSYGAFPATNFKREVQIESIAGTTDEVAIVVRVSWTKGLMIQEFKIRAYLFNWI